MVEHLEQHGAQLEHLESFPAPACPRSKFEAAMLIYLQLRPVDGRDGKTDGRRRAMLDALDGRATWDQIRHWRRGNARVPQWAKDLLADKIAKRRQLDASGESEARAA